MMQAADAAMYVAKRRKSGYAVYTGGPGTGSAAEKAPAHPDTAAGNQR